MSDFRTFRTARREPAQPLHKVIDPAAWEPHSLGDVANWSYHITESDADALVVAATRFLRTRPQAGRNDQGKFPA